MGEDPSVLLLLDIPFSEFGGTFGGGGGGSAALCRGEASLKDGKRAGQFDATRDRDSHSAADHGDEIGIPGRILGVGKKLSPSSPYWFNPKHRTSDH